MKFRVFPAHLAVLLKLAVIARDELMDGSVLERGMISANRLHESPRMLRHSKPVRARGGTVPAAKLNENCTQPMGQITSLNPVFCVKYKPSERTAGTIPAARFLFVGPYFLAPASSQNSYPHFRDVARQAGLAVSHISGDKRYILESMSGGGSYLSQNDPRLHFGLGEAKVMDPIVIRWPNGDTETLHNLAADAIYTITEGKGITNTRKLEPPVFRTERATSKLGPAK